MTRLACPHCHGRTFGWIVEVEQVAGIAKRHGSYRPEMPELGEILDSDADENGVVCRSCEAELDRDELIPTALSVVDETLQRSGDVGNAERDIAIEKAAHNVEALDAEPVEVIADAMKDAGVPREDRLAVRETLESREVAL